MANILEYLDWRGDIPFAISPFNEVDNLILAQISYTDLEGVMTQDEELPIEDVAEMYFRVHTEEEVLSRDTFYKYAPIVLKKAAESKRFQGTTLGRYMNIINTDREEQLSALTYKLPNGVSYVAFRGTDNTIVGWKEDFNLTFMRETAGQRRAVEYVNYYLKDTDEQIILGGHSKGGNFAVYAGAFCDDDIRDRIINVYSNDGPGFRDEILERDGYQQILPRVISILPEDSMVGIMLSNEYENHIVESSARLIYQHDPMTWQVYGTEFVQADGRTEGSKLLDKTMVKWLSTISDEDRAAFIDMMFESIDATGVTTLKDISEGGLKVVGDFIKSLREIPIEKQHEFSGMLRRLIKIGGSYVVGDMKKKARDSVDAVAPKLLVNEAKEQKKAIRKEAIDNRNRLTPEEVKDKSRELCRRILQSDIYKKSDIILAYMSTRNEVDLAELIAAAMRQHKRVYIPKVEDKTTMEFYRFDGRLTTGSFGILEPVNTEEEMMYDVELEYLMNPECRTLMIMPGVAFDKEKNRIGYGGGFYDRYLKRLEGYPVTTVAVAYDVQVVDSIPPEKYDIKPDAICTESQIIS